VDHSFIIFVTIFILKYVIVRNIVIAMTFITSMYFMFFIIIFMMVYLLVRLDLIDEVEEVFIILAIMDLRINENIYISLFML
jgi:hypothetical protein